MKYGQYSREELEKMEKSTVKFCDRNLDGLLFGYSNSNAGCVSLGEYGGFSLLLFENAIMEIREYFSPGILGEEHRYAVPKTCIIEIRRQYQKYHDEIKRMYAPNNGSCDGSHRSFYFEYRWIGSRNIEYHDENDIEMIRRVHRHDFDRVMKVVRKENEIMEFFFSICEILKRYDIVLDLYSVIVNGEPVTSSFSEFYADYYNCE